METASIATTPFPSPNASLEGLPWEVGPIVPPVRQRKTHRAAPLLRLTDRSVIALTLITAASLLLGSHGAHPPAPRELTPVIIVTGMH